MNSRRKFLLSLAASTGVPTMFGSRALAQTPPPVRLEESDPVGMAMGFKLDTTKVDGKKYPQHRVDQICSGCALYQEKAGDTWGPCTTFGNKLVPAAGWCLAYVKKGTVPK